MDTEKMDNLEKDRLKELMNANRYKPKITNTEIAINNTTFDEEKIDVIIFNGVKYKKYE